MAIIDCDVHLGLCGNLSPLSKYLPERWRKYLGDHGFRLGAATSRVYPRMRKAAAMRDSWPPDGGMPGSNREFATDQLLNRWQTSYAIINEDGLAESPVQQPEWSAAIASANNDYLLAEWIEPEPRLYASISVAQQAPDLAVAEIERIGANPRFVQVGLNGIAPWPLGDRRNWAIFEAAVRHGLPVGVHVGGASGHARTGAGWPSFYLEEHIGFSLNFQDHVVSLAISGIFDRLPNLRIVLQEGGFAWVPSLMWRLDRSYRLLRESSPALGRLPSEYIRDHFWFTTQPVEEPEKPEYFMQLLGQMGMDDRLLFASDYPHWDFDAPDQAVPRSVPAEVRQGIFAGNALKLYRRIPRVET